MKHKKEKIFEKFTTNQNLGGVGKRDKWGPVWNHRESFGLSEREKNKILGQLWDDGSGGQGWQGGVRAGKMGQAAGH